MVLVAAAAAPWWELGDLGLGKVMGDETAALNGEGSDVCAGFCQEQMVENGDSRWICRGPCTRLHLT